MGGSWGVTSGHSGQVNGIERTEIFGKKNARKKGQEKGSC